MIPDILKTVNFTQSTKKNDATNTCINETTVLKNRQKEQKCQHKILR